MAARRIQIRVVRSEPRPTTPTTAGAESPPACPTHEEDLIMDNLLTVAFEAHHPDKNHHHR